jgi:hypothetical protein
MSDSKANADRVFELAGAVCDGVVSQADISELDAMMSADYASRYDYMDYLRVHVALKLELRADLATQNMNRQIDVESAASSARGLDAASPPSPVPVHLLGGVIHGTTTYLSSGWPAAYLVATVILAIGLAIGAVTHVSQPMQIVQRHLPSPFGRGAGGEGGRTTDTAQSPVIGRITSTVDCQFAIDSKAEDQTPKTVVFLGDKFKLVSGLLEITYVTGARVILQGPVTYLVESPAGGFLSVGKLTAKMESSTEYGVQSTDSAAGKSKIQKPKSETNSKSPNLQISKFVVRTPTATVTDLGTEFGVAVSKEGRTEVHVLQGVVETRSIDARGALSPPQRVTEGLAVAIGLKPKGIESVAFAPQSFTRALRPADTPAERAYINAVLADRPMGYWTLNEPAGARKFADRSGNGLVGYAMNKVTAGQPGPLGDGSRSSGFNGGQYIDLGQHSAFAVRNNFTLEAWVWIDDAAESSYVFSAIGREGSTGVGWGLAASRQPTTSTNRMPKSPIFSFVVQQVRHFDFPLPNGESIKNRWLHVALTFDAANTARLYLNGKLRGSVAGQKPAIVGPVWLSIGCAEPITSDFWRGRLAHIAVYPRALDARHIQKHFDQCPSGGKEVPGKQP